MQIAWDVDSLQVESNVDGYKDVVKSVIWRCKVTDNDLSIDESGPLALGPPDENAFTIVDELGKNDVLAWVWVKIDKQAVELKLRDAMLELQQPIFETKTPPWV